MEVERGATAAAATSTVDAEMRAATVGGIGEAPSASGEQATRSANADGKVPEPEALVAASGGGVGDGAADEVAKPKRELTHWMRKRMRKSAAAAAKAAKATAPTKAAAERGDKRHSQRHRAKAVREREDRAQGDTATAAAKRPKQ